MSVLLLLAQAVGAWDTGTPSVEQLTSAALERREGWAAASIEGRGEIRGDAVITNGKLMAVARAKGSAVELYSLGTGKPVFRAALSLGAAIERVAVAESGRGAAALEVGWKGAGAARFRLKKGENFVESTSVAGEAPLRVACPSRFALLPDFFADDILFDARKVPVEKVELPSENFLLRFLGAGDAIVMDVFENREQDVRVTLGGAGEARSVVASEITYGKKGSKIWVAVLEGAGLWHAIDVTPADKKKILPLDWKMPFVAQWRVDFTRPEGLTDSWDLLLPDPAGDGYIKPSWISQDGKISEANRTSAGEVDRDAYKPGGPASDRLGADRKRWTTVLGKIEYPCWTDKERRGFIQPLENKRLSFDGPVLIYPSNRLTDTPVEAFTPVDVVRNTLGVGPCQYLLDVEGQKQEHVGRATCHVRTLLTETYTAGTQKTKAREIESWLKDAHDFVTHIRKRILTYVAFGQEIRAYVAAQRTSHPELKEPLDALEALAGEIDTRVAAGLELIRKHPTLAGIAAKLENPTPADLAAELNRQFLEKGLHDYPGADWKDKLKRDYTDPLTAIGGSQDDMVGECRWVVKALRQKAGLLMATDPRMAAIAAEIRARTQKVLRGGAAYEGARH